MLGVWILVGFTAIVVFLAFIKSFLKICPPNELLIFSGKTRKLPDGTTIGYRIIKGGRAFKIPIVETVHRMSLETIPIDIELKGALTKGVIPLNVNCSANVKIAGKDQEGLANAIERLLGKKREDIARIARETLEGSVRGVLATLSPEDANAHRLKFAAEVREQVAEDFLNLGLVLDTFKIEHISDSQNYLEAIGRKKNAEVQRDARIAEATSEAEARKVAADAKKEGDIAEAEAEQTAIESQNALRVKRADLDAKSKAAEAIAALAFGITEVQEEEKLEQARIERNKKRYEANVIIPAEAERKAAESRAKGEAARISEDGRATAEAVALMREQWDKGNTKELFMIQQMPELVEHVSKVVSENLKIEKLTVVDSNSNGIPTLARGLTGSVVSIIEEIKNSTGLDIPEILSRRNGSNGKSQLPKELS